MDAVTLAMAKKYTDSQRLGYSAYDMLDMVCFDGNIADKPTISGEALGLSGTYVHASDKVFDGGIALEADVRLGNGEIYSVKNLRVDKSGDGIWFLLGKMDLSGIHFEGERLLALSFGSALAEALGRPAGTYVWTETIYGYYFFVCGASGHFTETIHPIDPKFLPGVVVDLDKYGIGEIILYLFSQGGGTHTAEAVKEFWDAVSKGNELQLTMQYSPFTIQIAGVTRFIGISGDCDNVAFSFTVADTDGSVRSVSVSIARSHPNAYIAVKVV